MEKKTWDGVERRKTPRGHMVEAPQETIACSVCGRSDTCNQHPVMEERWHNALTSLETLGKSINRGFTAGIAVFTVAATIITGLFCYSSFVQVPGIRLDMSQLRSDVNTADAKINTRLDINDQKIIDMNQRLVKIEP
jgi:predicted amino acid-binding ACT domain protein